MGKEELISLLRKKGFKEEVVAAFEKVRREEFVPEHLIGYVYDDISLPIEDGSTISQPSTIAFMLELLEVKDKMRILEIGSGSGFVLSLLNALSPNGEIYGIELNKRIAVQAKKRLLANKRIHVLNSNGFRGLPEKAPFDRILVSATFKDKPYHLLSQLSENGILVAPVRDAILQIKKSGGIANEQLFEGFAFVPMVE